MNSHDPAMMTGIGAERRRNRRTALALTTLALVSFAGVIVRRWLFGA